MKKLFKKSLPLLMAGLMFLSSVLPVAATVSENQTITTPSTGITQVYYNQESTFGITIPKLIDLGSDKETNYTVTITGDISSDETIFVVPDESFLMKDMINTSSPKDDVEAIVTQDKTEWKFNEFSTIGNGNVNAPNLSAGEWQGSFWFNIKMKQLNILSVKEDMFLVEDSNSLTVDVSNLSGGTLSIESSDSSVATAEIIDNQIIVTPNKEGVATITLKSEATDEYIANEIEFKINVSHNFIDGICQRCGEKDVYELPAGLYDSNWNLKTSWDTLIANKTVYNNNGVIKTNNYWNNGEAINSSSSILNGILILPKGVVSLANNSFAGCDYLIGLVIPTSLQTIGQSSFYSMNSKLNTIIVDSENKNFKTVNGILYNIDMTELIKYPAGKTSTSFTVPKSVKIIGSSSFMANNYLKTVNIPYGIVKINNSAFDVCKNLTQITIPNSVTYLGNWAFSGCSNLTKVTLSDNLYSLGTGAFGWCKGLTKIYIPSSVKTMTTDQVSDGYRGVFIGCNSSLKIYCGASSKPSGWTAYWNCYKATINSSNYKLSTYWGYTRAKYNTLN